MIVRLVQAMQKEFRENTPKSISNLQAYSGKDGILEEQKSLKEWKIFIISTHYVIILLSISYIVKRGCRKRDSIRLVAIGETKAAHCTCNCFWLRQAFLRAESRAFRPCAVRKATLVDRVMLWNPCLSTACCRRGSLFDCVLFGKLRLSTVCCSESHACRLCVVRKGLVIDNCAGVISIDA